MEAFTLLHDVYVDARILAPTALGVRIRPQDLLPTTWTFIARDRGRIVAEVTLVGDTPLGMPMEANHPAEVAEVRQRGASMMECSGLACVPEYRDSGVTFLMYGLVHAVLHRQRIATMVMRVNQRQVPLYRDVLGCEPLGGANTDPGLMSIPFAPIAVDIASCEQRIRDTVPAGLTGADAVPQILFELAPEVLRWPESFTSPARLDGLAAIARAYPEILASRPVEVQRYVHDALAPRLAWPTGSSPFLPALAWPGLGPKPR